MRSLVYLWQLKKSLCSPGMYNLVGETDDKQIHEK